MDAESLNQFFIILQFVFLDTLAYLLKNNMKLNFHIFIVERIVMCNYVLIHILSLNIRTISLAQVYTYIRNIFKNK